ncbi:MAG: hypothetical protein ACOYXA_10155 [Bacteroidota bacterium]
MTHVRNVDALTRLVSLCSGYGGTYNPGRPTLQVKALATLLSQAQQALQNVGVHKARFEQARNARQRQFKEAVALAQRVARNFQAFRPAPETLADVRVFVRLLTGAQSRKQLEVTVAEGETPKVGRGRPRAFVSQAQYFAEMVQIIQTEAAYKPNEPALTPAALAAYAKQLSDLNKQVAEAHMAYKLAIQQRNELLYHSAQSVYATVQDVKNYLRALFTADSEQYRAALRLVVTKPAS